MDNTNENNAVDKDAERMLAAVRQTVLITNMSLAAALNTGFIAQYESDQGICNMALKPNNTAVVATTANIATLNVSGLTTVAELDNLGDSTVGGTLVRGLKIPRVKQSLLAKCAMLGTACLLSWSYKSVSSRMRAVVSKLSNIREKYARQLAENFLSTHQKIKDK